MKRSELIGLYYIVPIENVPSILAHGILSHNGSSHFRHSSVAMREIQERRENKKIPGTDSRLHDYANLYFDPHNPMLSKMREHNSKICVLRVSLSVLDLAGVIVTDRNASSDYARFYPVEEGLHALDKERLFAEFWIHQDDPYEAMRHKSEKCAEVLVPDCITPKYLTGAYVANQMALELFQNLNSGLPVDIRNSIFF